MSKWTIGSPTPRSPPQQTYDSSRSGNCSKNIAFVDLLSTRRATITTYEHYIITIMGKTHWPSKGDITSGLQLGRAEVLRGLRNFLNMDRPEHHSIDRLKERGVEKGSGRHSTLQGRERSVFNQAYIGTVSRATLGRLLRDGAERVWAFPSATMPS